MDDILKYEKDDSEDYYSLLGCDETSSEEQITAEYKARVIDCHPDKNPDDPTAGERFSRIQRAKDVLTDPRRRANYDRWRRSQLAVSYSQWCYMAPTQMSMHWACSKSQPMIRHTDNDVEEDKYSNTSIPNSFTPVNAAEYKQDSNTKGKRDKSPVNMYYFKDSPSDLIKKFRNYEI